MRDRYPNALWIDLLKADEFRRYLTRPELLREELAASSAVRHVVIEDGIWILPAEEFARRLWRGEIF